MANYVLVYKGGGGQPASEEQRQAVLGAWMRWYEGLGAAVVDGGNPFGASAVVAPDGSTTNGAPSGLTGYTIVSADSLDAAVAKAKDCPVLSDGGSVEVYETFAVM